MRKVFKAGLAILCSASLVMGLVGVLPQSVSATEEAALESLPTDFKEITPRDFGIQDGTQATSVGNSKTPTNSFDKVKLSMNLKFTEAGKGVTYLSTQTKEHGLRFWLTNGHTIYMSNWCSDASGIVLQNEAGTQISNVVFSPANVFPSDSGIVWFDGADFNLTVTTEIVTRDGVGEKNDLKIGVWFNGVLYDNQYYYLLNIDPDTHPLQQSFYVQGGDSITVTSPFVTHSSPLDEYDVMTPHDFGIGDEEDNAGGISYKVKDTKKVSVDKLAFATNMQYGLKGSYITVLYDDTLSNGIHMFLPDGISNPRLFNYLAEDCNMYAGSKENKIPYRTYFEIDKTVANLPKKSFLSLNISSDYIFELWFTMDLVDFNEDNNRNDLKLGIWFNGELYNNMYFYIENCLSEYTPYFEVSGVKHISSPQIGLTSVGMEAGVYAAQTRENYTSDLVKNSTLNKVTFEAPILFSRVGGTFYYGGEEQAVMLSSTDEGLVLKHTFGGTETQLDVLNTNNIGFDTVNRALNLRLSTEVVNTNDILLGVCVNGKYRSYQITGVATLMKAYVGIQTAEGATIALGEQANETPAQVEYCLTYGKYTKEKTTDMQRLSVNGVASDTDVAIDTCGIYSIAYTQDDKIYMEEVLAYYVGDVNSDNKTDIKDLIRVLKIADANSHEQTVATLTEVGKKVIGYTSKDAWTDVDSRAAVREVKNVLIGSQSTYEEYTNFKQGYLYNSGAGLADWEAYHNRLYTADHISIDDFIDISVDESYTITWFPYRKDYRTFGSTDYVTGYAYSTENKVTSITKEEILKVAPSTAYVKFMVERVDTEDKTKMDPTQLSTYGLVMRVRNIPGTRIANITAVDKAQLAQFANADGAITKDFTIDLSLNDMQFLEDIWILSSNAKYETVTGAQPTIQYELIDYDTDEVLYYAFPYVIGGEGEFEQQEWRIPGLDPGANEACKDMGITASPYDTVRIDFVIPDGVKLYINELTDKENYLGTVEANEGVKYISHTGLYNYAPENTLLAFEMAGQMGYDSLVTIVKFTKDNIPICFHDDGNIRFLLTYKDGTAIPNDNSAGSEVPVEERVDVDISNYTYAEICERFSAGYKKDPIYQNLNVPTLEDYLDICVKYQMEPQFSVHPNLEPEQWTKVAELMEQHSTPEWNLLEHFYVKTGDLNELTKTQQIFGKSIGGYILIVPNGASADYGLYSIAQRAGFVKDDNPNEVDFDGYNLSVAFFQQSKTVNEGVEAALAAGFERIDMYGFWGISGQEFAYWIDKGVMHYCLDYHTSPGLNW